MVPEKTFNKGKGNISQVSIVHIRANSSATALVKILCIQGAVFLEPLDSLDTSLQTVESFVEIKEDGFTVVEITNTGKLTPTRQCY